MPRPVSDYARNVIYMPQVNDGIMMLLTITEGTLPAPLRFCTNIEYIMSRGNAYMPSRFGVDPPIDDGETLTKGRIIIGNIDRAMVHLARTALDRPTVTFEAGVYSAPDDIEYGPVDFLIEDISASLNSITATAIAHPGFWNVWPQYTRSPARNPELFLTGA